MRRNLWISAVLLAAVGTPAVRGADTAAPLPSTDRYRAALLAPDTKQAPRDEAARRLVAGGTAADVAAIRDALLPGAAPAAQASAARAISIAYTRDPTWVEPLVLLLGSNRVVSDQAIAALANFAATTSNDRAFDALQRFAVGQAPALARAPAVRAMSGFPNRSAAEFLVAAIANGNNGPTLQSAAAEALREMSGESDRGANGAQWQAWWSGHAKDSQADWQAYLERVHAIGNSASAIRQAQFASEALFQIKSGYKVLPLPSRTPALASYLDSRSGPIRALGAELALGDLDKPAIIAAVLPRLRDLIADEDPDVRLNAVKAVQAAVDQPAGPILVAQLQRERTPEVLKQMFLAVGKLQNLDAAPVLASLLNDARPDVAAAAARTLGDPENGNGGLGKALRAQRPNVADKVCAEMRRILAARPNPAFDALRAECAKALTALGEPEAFNIYRNLLNAQPAESSRVRCAALSGLGALGDTRADAFVSNALGDSDQDVRLAAARAMLTVGQLLDIEQLKTEMGPQEADGDVRDAAWLALAHLLEDGSVDLLSKWVTRFPDDPIHRLSVQREYSKSLQKAGQTDLLASNNQDLAATLVELKRPDEAIAPLQAALDYYQNNPAGGGTDHLESLVGQMLAAQLSAHRWTDAATFAGREIKQSTGYQPVVGRAFEDAAENLKKDRDMDDLNALIAAAKSIQPELEKRFIDFLQQIHDEPQPSAPHP